MLGLIRALGTWLEQHAKDVQAEAKIILPRDAVAPLYAGLVHLRQIEFLSSDLESRVARAYTDATHGKGVELTRLRRATRRLWGRPIMPGKRGKTIPAHEVALNFFGLTQSKGDLVFERGFDRALGIPPEVVPCPVTPWEAIALLTRWHGFQSQDACLRFLQGLRKRGRIAVDSSHDDAVGGLLDRLPARRPEYGHTKTAKTDRRRK